MDGALNRAGWIFNIRFDGIKGVEWVKYIRSYVCSLGPARIAHHVSGQKAICCEMSMNLMGIRREEIIDFSDITIADTATFLVQSGSSKFTLFI